MLIGYARVSSTGQDHAAQLDRLKAHGCEKIYEEKVSGLDRDRPALAKALDKVREGDVLVVTKLDRLARSASHLHQIVDQLAAEGAGIRVLDDSGIDTTTRSGKLLFWHPRELRRVRDSPQEGATDGGYCQGQG